MIPVAINAGWLRELISAAAGGSIGLHEDWIGDSTGTSGADAGHVPYLLGRIVTTPAPISGVPACDVLATDYGPLAMTQQWNTNQINASLINPGQATDEGNQGNHLGVLFKFAFTGNKANTERIRKYIFPAPSGGNWGSYGNHLFDGSDVTGRVLVLRTPAGLTGANAPSLVGKRGGTAIDSFTINCASPNTGGVDEFIDAYEVTLGAGAGSPLELEVNAGPGDETGKVVQLLSFHFLANLSSPKGMYWTTSSIGSWTTKAHASSDSIPPGVGTYTGQYSDAALQSWIAKTGIAGSQRIGWILLGTNDGFTQAQRRAYLTTLIQRRTAQAIAAGFPYRGFVVMAAPDPGPVPSAKYTTFDEDAEWAVTALGTPSVPICGIKMRPAFPINGTIAGDGLSMAGVHATQPTAIEVMRRTNLGIMGSGSTGRITRMQPRIKDLGEPREGTPG